MDMNYLLATGDEPQMAHSELTPITGQAPGGFPEIRVGGVVSECDAPIT
jgi:hypothetical protein